VVKIDGRLLVLGGVTAHTDAEDEAPTREVLERGGLLGHRSRMAQRELQHARPQGDPSGGGGGDGQRGEALVDRVGPEEMVDGP
jgi:hypothetical protein